MMKKILTIFFVFMTFFLVGERASCEDDPSTLETLTALGIVTEPLDDTLTRGQYAQMISNIFAYDNADYAADRIYTDVPQGHAYANAINKLSRYGIITADQNFYPDSEITDAQAATMLVRMLGYQLAADRNGGFPDGYIRQASSLGLYDGTSGKTDSERMVTMLYNALEVDIMKINLEGDYELSGTTLLADVLRTSVIRGRINAVAGTSIEKGAEVAEGTIKVGDTVMYADADSVRELRDLVGMEATVYYTINDDGDYTYLTHKQGSNEIVEIPLDKLISIEGRDISYETDNGRTRTVRLSSTVPNIIYNYGNVDDIPELGEIGTLRVILGGSGYDTLIIKDYRTYMASGFDRGELFTSFPEERSFKTEDYKVFELIGLDGYAFNPENITENMVLSVLECADYMLEITVSNNVMNGKLSAFNAVADSNAKLLEINGAEYRTTEELGEKLATEGYERFFNTIAVYYLDAFGNIAYVETEGGYRLKVGYCTRVYEGDDGETIILKVFTTDNSFKRYNVCQKNGKYLVDGEYIRADAFISQFANPQLIGYRLQNGEIREIETVASEPRDGLYRFSSTSSGRYNSAQSSFGADVIMDSDAVIFNIPRDAEDQSEEKYYSVTWTKPWINSTNYGSVEFYATDEEALESNIIIWRRDYGGSADSKQPMMVEEIVEMVDADENIVTRIYGWRNGTGFSLTAKPGSDIRTASRTLGNRSVSDVTLGFGDIVVGAETPDIRIGYTQIVYDYSEDAYLPSSNPYTQNNNSYCIICGEITAKQDDIIKVSLRGSEEEEFYRISAVTPILCDGKEIREATYLDANVGNTVVIYSNNGTAQGVYIYK